MKVQGVVLFYMFNPFFSLVPNKYLKDKFLVYLVQQYVGDNSNLYVKLYILTNWIMFRLTFFNDYSLIWLKFWNYLKI